MGDYEETEDFDYEQEPVAEDDFEESAEVLIDPKIGVKPSTETQILLSHHPEIWVDYSETVKEKLVKGDTKQVSYPFLTQFEKTKVLSFRASQLAQGSKPYVEVPDTVSDLYIIAKMELKMKKLPFIVKRPLPDGNYEYWSLRDLMVFD
jgi:DNA-directed RNA polymerase I, II, and III subunit RPABC2